MNKLVRSDVYYPTVVPVRDSRSAGGRNKAAAAARRFLFKNNRRILLCACLIAVGAAFGVFAYIRMSVENKNAVFAYMQNYFSGSVLLGASPGEIFRAAFPPLLVTGIIMVLGGILPPLLPFALARLIFKGFSMGFSTAFFIARYGLKGAAFALVSVVLCGALPLCASVWLLLECRSARGETPPKRGKKRLISWFAVKPKALLRAAVCLAVFACAALVSALFNSVIGHGMMKSLYGIFSAF